MKKWKSFTIAAMSMALGMAAFLGTPQLASAAGGASDAQFYDLAQASPVVLTNGVVRNETIQAGSELVYEFTAPAAAKYSFFTEGSVDTEGYLYNNIAMQDSNKIANNDDYGSDINFKMSVNLAADQKVYLKVKGYGSSGFIKIWACQHYTIRFNGNGSLFGAGNVTKLHGIAATLPGEVPSKSYRVTYDANGGEVKQTSQYVYCTQLGWNTATDGTGNKYALRGSYDLNGDRTLYAEWENPTLEEMPTPTNDDVPFQGWYDAVNGGNLITPDTPITSDMTLYARWDAGLQITNQPAPATAIEGEQVTFSVRASGSDLTYQWQYSKDGGTTWTNSTASGAKTATMVTNVKTSFDGRQYRCIVKDGTESVTSEVATLTVKVSKPVITSQPANQSVAGGENAKFSVSAVGAKLTYQWQYSKDGGVTWVNNTVSSAKSATLSLTTKESWTGRLYHCIVTNEMGSVTSRAVKLTVQLAKPEISTQPVSVSAKDGERVKFITKATGTNLTYQWQYSKDGGVTWVNNTVSSAKSATLSLTVKDSWNGRLYHCIVTNESGSVTTEAAALQMDIPAPVISTQPVDAISSAGKVATFSVAASGSNLKYQWQYSKDGINWTNSTAAGAKTATMETNVKASFNGRQYRCIVTNGGGSDCSETATLTVK